MTPPGWNTPWLGSRTVRLLQHINSGIIVIIIIIIIDNIIMMIVMNTPWLGSRTARLLQHIVMMKI